MSTFNSFSEVVNKGAVITFDMVNKIATNPSADKKILQIISKLIAALDLYHGHTHCPEFSKSLKGATNLIEFYGTFKNILYWINPFTNSSLDQQLFKTSLADALLAERHFFNEKGKREEVVTQVFKDVMANPFYSANNVLDAVKISLATQGLKEQEINKITQQILIQKKSRPLSERIAMVFFTVVDISGNLLTLQKWGILDLSKIALQIGSQCRVFMFVVNLGAETVLGTLASVGLSIMFVAKTVHVGFAISHYLHATNQEEKDKAGREIWIGSLDLISIGADLVYTTAPLLFVVNPGLMIALALVAKGTGLLVILIR